MMARGRNWRALATAALLVACASMAVRARAQGPCLDAKLVPPEGSTWTALGGTILMHGDTVVATSTVSGPNTGGVASLWRHDPDGWQLVGTVPVDEGLNAMSQALSLSGDADTLVVGYPRAPDPPGEGVADVFARSGGRWLLQARIRPEVRPAAGDTFARRSAVRGDRLLVTDERPADLTGEWRSSAYVFARQPGGAWQEDAFLEPLPGGNANPWGAGCTVALGPDVAVVGYPDARRTSGTDPPAVDGVVVVHRRETGAWTLDAVIDRRPIVYNSLFGAHLQFDGQRLAVADAQPTVQVLDGAAGGWPLVAEVPGWPAAFTAGISQSFALRAGLAVLGARSCISPGGCAELYAEQSDNRWTEIESLTGATGDPGRPNLFGQAVALTAERVAVGAPWEDATHEDSGAIYIYDVACLLAPADGGDGDGIDPAVDNCPDWPNPYQEDADGDGVGDVCDDCPAVADASQADSDSDGTGDACDLCPADPEKTDSGACGCGVFDADEDRDFVADCVDLCPGVTGRDNTDADGDGLAPPCDNCPDVANPGQADADDDGIGDACDAVFCAEPSALHRDPGAEPLRVTRDVSGALVLSWQDTGAGLFHAYRGSLVELRSGRYDQAAFGACDLAATPSVVPDEPGAWWYVVAADCGQESGLGRDSRGRLRPAPTTPCP